MSRYLLLTELYWWVCTGGSVLVGLYWWVCAGGSVLVGLYWWVWIGAVFPSMGGRGSALNILGVLRSKMPIRVCTGGCGLYRWVWSVQVGVVCTGGCGPGLEVGGVCERSV